MRPDYDAFLLGFKKDSCQLQVSINGSWMVCRFPPADLVTEDVDEAGLDFDETNRERKQVYDLWDSSIRDNQLRTRYRQQYQNSYPKLVSDADMNEILDLVITTIRKDATFDEAAGDFSVLTIAASSPVELRPNRTPIRER